MEYPKYAPKQKKATNIIVPSSLNSFKVEEELLEKNNNLCLEPQTGNKMMAAIMAKRNQMKKVGGGGAETGASPKPEPPRQSAPQAGYNSGLSKPIINEGLKPKEGEEKSSSIIQRPMTSTTYGNGGVGGGGAFAAKMAALKARMGGRSSAEECE